MVEAAPAPYEGDLYKNSWAVLIGINKYYNKPWSDYPLDYADADAKSMAKLLVERFGFKKENIGLLVDDNAMGLIVPMDGRGKEATTLYATAIAMSEFRNLSELVVAKHLLFLLDACSSGLATSRYYATPPRSRSI